MAFGRLSEDTHLSAYGGLSSSFVTAAYASRGTRRIAPPPHPNPLPQWGRGDLKVSLFPSAPLKSSGIFEGRGDSEDNPASSIPFFRVAVASPLTLPRNKAN